jgi:hypothetical protein
LRGPFVGADVRTRGFAASRPPEGARENLGRRGLGWSEAVATPGIAEVFHRHLDLWARIPRGLRLESGI